VATAGTRPALTDTHVHFFELGHPSLRYSWLEDEPDPELDVTPLRQEGDRYWPDDFLAETRAANVARVVHVQAATGSLDPVDETHWLQAHAARIGVPHAMIVDCDLAGPDAQQVIERHLEASPLVAGVRDLRAESRLETPAWQRGLALLERYGLVACVAPGAGQMTPTADLARRHPGLTVCIDHAGLPLERTDEYFVRWRTGMAEIAALPNTVVKVSGLGMFDRQWTIGSLRPWVVTCIELWGADRSCFGSNWPIDRLFSSYDSLVDAYDRLLEDLLDADRDAFFRGTADRVFTPSSMANNR
jgi:predicted TIM-barrel fold metal-dependent hydrolase